MSTRAFIIGCAGPALDETERRFIAAADPWGLILFRRNVVDRAQLRALADSFRSIVGRADAPVLVDQEGGRVQRLGPPHWRAYPPAAAFDRACNDPHAARELARLSARLMAHDLAEAGITVDCAPVLDVPAPGSHQIVGDRAYAALPGRAAVLARACAEGLIAGGVLPVIKHMPGHGRAKADSHVELPVVTAPREELEANDFSPFRVLADMPLAMSAHVVFTALDPTAPATTSRRVVRSIMRGALGYDGLIMSDDLSMQALQGSLRQRAEAAFRAGLDMALHCNGKLDEMEQVAAAAPVLAGKAKRRARAALDRLRKDVEPFDPVDAARRLDLALANKG
ncbi:MAG: beta-N-acetylhexosaminidase [Methylobacteriaceae bacterium]|nr:beta-N-acetylhexosaminidase [Methylobacteriaceae bacterium]